MATGHIFVAQHQGCYLLKFEGDIRLTLSVVLEDYINLIFADQNFVSVSVDLTCAEGLDSTSLGILAKLAIHMEKQHEVKPLLFSTNPDVTTILLRMGLDDIFQIKNCDSGLDSCEILLDEIKQQAKHSESHMRQHVLEAHKVLMNLNEKNHLAFSELVQTLNN